MMSEFMLAHPELWGQMLELLVIALVILLAQGKIPFRQIANAVLAILGRKPLPNGNGRKHAEGLFADLSEKLVAHDQQNGRDFKRVDDALDKMEKLMKETRDEVHALHIEMAGLKGSLGRLEKAGRENGR